MSVQEFFEETAEYEAGVHAGQRRRVAGLSRRKSLTAPKEQTFDVPGAVSCYCRCMQHMLQASTPAAMLPRESHIDHCLRGSLLGVQPVARSWFRSLESGALDSLHLRSLPCSLDLAPACECSTELPQGICRFRCRAS